MEEKVKQSSGMDSVLAYRNYLAAEDHLDELIFNATSSDKKKKLEDLMERTISLRDQVMPPEVDPDEHCLVKHYAVAYEGMRERWKADMTEDKYWQKKEAYSLLIDALQMLWDREIHPCERCKPKEDYGRTKDTGDSGSSDGDGAGHGKSRDVIQTVSEDRSTSSESMPTPSEIRDRIIEAGVDRSARAVENNPYLNGDSVNKNSGFRRSYSSLAGANF